MSESVPGRVWRFYLDDMLGFCRRVTAFTEGLDQAGFEADVMRYDATLRNIELIGEAATHVPDEVRQASPGVPWRLMVATRNRLIHGYLGIDNDILWSIIQTDIPQLIIGLESLRGRADLVSRTDHPAGPAPIIHP